MAIFDISGSDLSSSARSRRSEDAQGGAVVIDMEEHGRGEPATLWLVGLNQTSQTGQPNWFHSSAQSFLKLALKLSLIKLLQTQFTAVPDDNDVCSFIFRDVMSAVAPSFPFREAVSKAASRPFSAFVSAIRWLDQPRMFCKFGDAHI